MARRATDQRDVKDLLLVKRIPTGMMQRGTSYSEMKIEDGRAINMSNGKIRVNLNGDLGNSTKSSNEHWQSLDSIQTIMLN